MNVAVENRFQAGRKPKTCASAKRPTAEPFPKNGIPFNELIQSEIIQWAVTFSYGPLAGCTKHPARALTATRAECEGTVRPPFPPMEALSVDEIPTGSGWQYEPK